MTSPPLLWPAAPRETRILYLARFAPDDPFYSVKPEGTTTGYAEYHFRIFEALRDIGYSVASSSKPYAALMAGGNTDFVFSLLNRMPIRNPELLVPAICTYLRLPGCQSWRATQHPGAGRGQIPQQAGLRRDLGCR